MRKIFTAAESGLSRSALAWGVKAGKWVSAGYGAYAEGPQPVSIVEQSIAAARARGGAVSGAAAGELFGLDSITADVVDFTIPPGTNNKRAGARRQAVCGTVEVEGGVIVTNGTQTMIDLASYLDNLRWEQALESALRNQLTQVCALEAALPAMSSARTPGVVRIRRVLALRPVGAPPTESLLETLAVQLFREAGLPDPTRQFEVRRAGRFVARVDLAWPDLGAFVELDGQHHAGQPVYDASRQTAVIAATGWLPARFTWRQVVHNRRATGREMREVLRQAEARRAARRVSSTERHAG